MSFVLDRIGSARLALKDAPGALAAFERLAISRDLAELRKGSTEAQTDLVVGLYKLAEVADGERKSAVIDEGLQILARLDADGKLSDDQKGWSESFLAIAESRHYWRRSHADYRQQYFILYQLCSGVSCLRPHWQMVHLAEHQGSID